MRSILSRFLVLSILLILTAIFIFNAPNAKADQAQHVVISEIQTGGTTATDEFVELYNPTNSDVDLSDWQLNRKTSGGTESTLVGTLSGTIKSHGYFLIAHPDYSGSVAADLNYSEDNSLSSDNTILLYSDQGTTLIDKVGFGSAVDFEGTSETNPSNGTSRERIANSDSTSLSMSIGGEDEFMGNGEDSDNNASDFVLRNTPQPQNSNSDIEPITEDTPTDSPTITDTPTTTPSPTVTETPTDTPSPTETPTVTPTDTPAPTATETPTITPTPTVTVEPSPTPIASFPSFDLVCTTKTKVYRMFYFEIRVPFLTCKIVHH